LRFLDYLVAVALALLLLVIFLLGLCRVIDRMSADRPRQTATIGPRGCCPCTHSGACSCQGHCDCLDGDDD
jgi:hypothetical protein